MIGRVGIPSGIEYTLYCTAAFAAFVRVGFFFPTGFRARPWLINRSRSYQAAWMGHHHPHCPALAPEFPELRSAELSYYCRVFGRGGAASWKALSGGVSQYRWQSGM